MEQRWPGQMVDGQARGVHGAQGGRRAQSRPGLQGGGLRGEQHYLASPRSVGTRKEARGAASRCSRGPGSVRAGACAGADLGQGRLRERDCRARSGQTKGEWRRGVKTTRGGDSVKKHGSEWKQRE